MALLHTKLFVSLLKLIILVHAHYICRYIKAYWSKMKIRDTVISEEQERMLLERILSEEENDRDDVSDHVTDPPL